MAWDEEKRTKAIAMYLEMEPTPTNSMECVAEVAESLGESVNGVRAILSKANVYVKKEDAPSKTEGTTKAKASGGTRVSKDEAQAQLIAALEAAGKEVDNDIVSKLTGKAALYFAQILA